jgi:hypothetical protein
LGRIEYNKAQIAPQENISPKEVLVWENLYFIEETNSTFLHGIVDKDIHFLNMGQKKVSEGLDIFMTFLTYG